MQSKEQKVIELANNYLNRALVSGTVQVSEVQVTYSTENDYERVLVKCPLCSSEKFISLVIKRTVKPRQVYVGNFKLHVETVHVKNAVPGISVLQKLKLILLKNLPKVIQILSAMPLTQIHPCSKKLLKTPHRDQKTDLFGCFRDRTFS
jgi:hypothetical protein